MDAAGNLYQTFERSRREIGTEAAGDATRPGIYFKDKVDQAKARIPREEDRRAAEGSLAEALSGIAWLRDKLKGDRQASLES
jgi:hypothetical protein